MCILLQKHNFKAVRAYLYRRPFRLSYEYQIKESGFSFVCFLNKWTESISFLNQNRSVLSVYLSLKNGAGNKNLYCFDCLIEICVLYNRLCVLIMLYKYLMANTSAIWQQNVYPTYQLSSPSCSTRAIQKVCLLTKTLKNVGCGWGSGERAISRQMTRQKEHRKKE